MERDRAGPGPELAAGDTLPPFPGQGEPASAPRGCVMCSSLYLRFNGQLPCWDHVGEGHVLRTVTREGLESGRERDLFSFPELLHIRGSFAQGALPYPGDCERCALLGHLHGGLPADPERVRVLHVEPSFACHLSCPLCIPAKARRRLMPPPHSMDPALFEAFLGRLREDGVREVGVLLFEGRGDPLMNPALGRMVRAAKAAFPRTVTNVVTHGCYPFRPWLVTGGLDVLTLAVDGVRPESYARYRVGGDLGAALALMRSACEERRRERSPLRVVWRYILFEWNDGDDELREAARLAATIGAELRFLRTHSEGRSLRFADGASLSAALRRLGVDAAEQSTFELKSREGTTSSVDHVAAEHAAALLAAAREAFRRGDQRHAVDLLDQALARDPGIAPSRGAGTVRERLGQVLGEVLQAARAPSTLSGLAALCREGGDGDGSSRLLERYLQLAPGAADRGPIAAERHLKEAIAALRDDRTREAVVSVRTALRLDPGLVLPEEPVPLARLVACHLDTILQGGPAPSTLCALAFLCDRLLGDRASAAVLYSAYLRAGGDPPDREDVERRLRRLERGWTAGELAGAVWRRVAPRLGLARAGAAHAAERRSR